MTVLHLQVVQPRTAPKMAGVLGSLFASMLRWMDTRKSKPSQTGFSKVQAGSSAAGRA